MKPENPFYCDNSPIDTIEYCAAGLRVIGEGIGDRAPTGDAIGAREGFGYFLIARALEDALDAAKADLEAERRPRAVND